MSALEERLADAYQAAAETVRPETIPAPPSPGPPSPSPKGRRRPPRAPARLAVPLAAAAAVAAIAVAAVVLVPKVWTGRPAAPDGWNAPPPRYYAAVINALTSTPVLDIVNASTGRVTGQLVSPRHGTYFQQVASLGNDRSFVAAAAVPMVAREVERDCHTFLYRFRITASGRPTALRPLSVPDVSGYPLFNTLAGSADGTTIAYATNLDACSRRPPRGYAGRVSVLRLATGRITSWGYNTAALPASLSLSADGQVLGLVSGLGQPPPAFAAVLRTASPAGPLDRYWHKVTKAYTAGGVSTWSAAVALTRSARTMLISVVQYRHHANTSSIALREYQPTTGRPERTMHVLRIDSYWPGADGPALAPSNSGRYVLVYMWRKPFRLDLATGRAVSMPLKTAAPDSAAW